MAKLYFRYGTVGSAKTLNLLAVAHNYERQGKRVLVLKPALDTRFGAREVTSRAGLERQADILVSPDTHLDPKRFAGCDCVLVDEAQFLSAPLVEELRALTRVLDIPVICYGLRTDFRTLLFAGSRRLLELADSIEELKTTCAYCNRKAVLNLKSAGGAPTLAGPSTALGCEETYLPVCYRHYTEKLGIQNATVAREAASRASAAESDTEGDSEP
jgi:thymidine kinase